MPALPRIGCSSWTSEAWWGRVYPATLKSGERLAYYARSYDAVEIDSTYYRDPGASLFRRWSSVTPDGFVFAVKFPRDLLDPKEPLNRLGISAFLEHSRELGPKLGPILLQFPPWVKPGRASGFLDGLLEALDPGLRYTVELRSPEWFVGEAWDSLRKRLEDRRVALTWSYLTYLDVPAERTADFVYLRFIGDHTTVPEAVHGEVRIDRAKEIGLWAGRLKESLPSMEAAFAFFNNHFEGFAPESVNRFRATMGLPQVEYRVGTV